MFFRDIVSVAIAMFICSAQAAPTVLLPRTGLLPDDVAIVINEADDLSRRIGDYYRRVRGIPETNVIRIRFPPDRSMLPADEFAQLKHAIDLHTPAHVQAYAVTWTQPYRVGCMSLTSALALGVNERYCATQCRPTATSPYFNSPSLYPAIDHKLRPAMMLAGESFERAKALIDRGIASDRSFPEGRAYLLSTSDKTRSVRAAYFKQAASDLDGVFPIELLEQDSIDGRNDVLFYFTGIARVPKLDTLHFMPGAFADHLTSFGGQLTDSSQMSSLEWLAAGATASYGTVVEPCNLPEKFPSPALAMFFYARGASAIESYWKSVARPGQGVFIGEPLARPFAPSLRELEPGKFELQIYSAREGKLQFEYAASPMGPFTPLPQTLPLRRGPSHLRFALPVNLDGYVRLKF